MPKYVYEHFSDSLNCIQKTTDSGKQDQRLVCVIVLEYIRAAGGWIMPTRTDVQTDVHIVPVDSDSPIRNLLKVQTVRYALVPWYGN